MSWLDDWVRGNPKTAVLLCNLMFPIFSGQDLPEVAQGRKTGDRVMDGQGSLMHLGNKGWLFLVWANRRFYVAQITKNVNAGNIVKVSEHTQCITVRCVWGMRSCRPVRMPMLPCVPPKSTYNGNTRIGPQSYYIRFSCGWLRVCHLGGGGTTLHYGKKASRK